MGSKQAWRFHFMGIMGSVGFESQGARRLVLDRFGIGICIFTTATCLKVIIASDMQRW